MSKDHLHNAHAFALHPIRKRLRVGLLFILFILVSCSVELPSYVIPEGKMERILYDYHIAQGMADAQGDNKEENRYLYIQKVFEKHHITEAEFDTSMVWYSGHANHLEDMYKRIDARLERESDKAGLNIPEEDQFMHYTADGDTANIWSGRDMLFMYGNRESNLYSLSIPTDSTFQRGDSFRLRCSNRFITADGQHEGYILMQLEYEGDTIVSATSAVVGDYDATLNIEENRVPKNRDLKQIRCTYYYSFDESREEKFRMWVVSRPLLLRFHHEITEEKDTLSTDSLDTDTAVQFKEQGPHTRITPEELRKQQQVDRKIDIVEKKSVVLPVKPAVNRRRVP